VAQVEKFLQNRLLGGLFNYLSALVLVMSAASVLIFIQGSSPPDAFYALFRGAVGSTAAIASSIRWTIPVLVSAMAAVVAQRSGIINLGLDGQVYFGAFFAAIVGAFFSISHPFHIMTALLAGSIAGLLYALIPALLKIFLGIDEMITTLMFNYISILLTEFFTMKLMGLGANANPDMIATPEILNTAKLKSILPPYQATTGIFIAVAIVILVWAFYRYTRAGYEWKILGRNAAFARYGGIRVIKNYLVVFLLSGFLAGMCGAVEILGPHLRFRNNFANNLGWDGIMVALIAGNNPLGAAVVGILWGMIKAGSLSMERMTSVNRILVTLLQALFVLFITVDFRSLLLRLLVQRGIKRRNGGPLNV
jgi:simple sugar transport system permease protein